MLRNTIALLLTLSLCVQALSQTRDPMARSSVPANGILTITDYGFRDWGPQLVQYTVDTSRFRSGQCVLVGQQGHHVPCQIDGDVLSFVATVPQGASVTYTLLRRSGGGASALRARVQGQTLEIRNEQLALRVPAPAEKEHAAPIEASRATPPILQWCGAGSAWIGGARFVTSRKVAHERFTVIRQGPAVVEYEARYTFAPEGRYVFRVRLSPGMPVAVVTEEFDFGEIGKGEDVLLLDLHRGWQPNHIGWIPGSGEEQLPILKPHAYREYVDAKLKTRRADAPVGGVGQPPQPFRPEKDLTLLETILPAGRWGDAKGGVQVWDGDIEEPGSGRNVGLVPLSAGSWRRAMALCGWHNDSAGITVALPLGVRWSRWSLEVTDDHSPFSTHEHDPGLRPSYGRRSQWHHLRCLRAEHQPLLRSNRRGPI